VSALRKLWSLRRRRPWFVAGSLGVLAFLLAYPFVHWWLQSAGIAGRFGYFDLGAYRSAVNNWLAGDPLYVENDDGGYHGSYLYPPVFVLLFVPVAETSLLGLSFRQAGVLLNVVSVGLLWAGLQAAVAGFGLSLAWYERGLLLWAVAGFGPVIVSMQLAQVSVFLAALLTFGLVGVLYDDEPDGRLAACTAGAATAVAGTMKLVYAPVGAHLLQDRRRFAAAVATGLALAGLSVTVFGVDSHLRYLDVLTWGKGWGESRAPYPPYLWLPPYYRPFHAVGATAGLVARAGLTAAITAVALLSADADVEVETFALGAAAIPLIAPRAYTQDLAVLLPAAVALLATELRRADGRPLVPVVGVWLAAVHAYGLLALVVLLNDHVVPALNGLLPWAVAPAARAVAAFGQPGLWAALLLVGLAMYRVAAAASRPGWVDGR